MFETAVQPRALRSEFWILFIRTCFEFRYSDFGFRISDFLDEIDFLAFLQSHDGFLPTGTSSHGPAHAFLLARVITSVHIDHFLLKQAFDRVLNLNFIGARTHAKDILVLLFAHQG